MRTLLFLLPLLGVIFAQAPQAAPKPKLELRGDRFPGLTYDQLTPAQKDLADRALAGRGAIGSFNITLRSPELSEIIRGTSGPRTLSELMPRYSELGIIINARYWNTQFEWLVHRQAAERAGISKETTSAIASGVRPTSMKADEEVIYNFLQELLTTKRVSDPAFAAAKTLLGEKGMVDLIGIVGLYQVTSLMMNVDRYPMQPNQVAELKPLKNSLPLLTARAQTQRFAAKTNPETQLRGDRFAPLGRAEMSKDQAAFLEQITSGKIQGGTGGPFNVLLRSPGLGEGVVRFGEYVRFRSPIPAKLNELATLVTTRYWSAQFPWYAHHRAAVQAGLPEAVAAAIRSGQRPRLSDPQEVAVYNFTSELLRTTQVSDVTFAAAKQHLGERGVVELLGIMGYYGIVSMAVNIDGYPLPEGLEPELGMLESPLPE